MTENIIQKPSLGRVVHYVSRGSADGRFAPKPRAAIITEVLDSIDPAAPAVSLSVFNPTGLFFDTEVPYSPDYKPGHWSWPPRV